MSSYYLLADHAIGAYVLSAGSSQSTADAGGLLPTGWSPSNNVDPLDAGALAAFYANGPCLPSLFRPTQAVKPPKTFWQRTFDPNNPGAVKWTLAGLGSGLAAVFTQNGVGAAL
jgi:hypothetical protein